MLSTLQRWTGLGGVVSGEVSLWRHVCCSPCLLFAMSRILKRQSSLTGPQFETERGTQGLEFSRGLISLGHGKVSNQRGHVDFSSALVSPADTVLPR